MGVSLRSAAVSGLSKLSVVEVRAAVPAGTGVEAGMVVLAEESQPHRMLRIVIGQPEARAIHLAWRGGVPGRPSTWDLFVSVVALLGARVERAVITAVEQQRHFFAALDLERDGQRWSVNCRPSDAIALALRTPERAIFSAPEVLDSAGVTAGVTPGGTEATQAGAGEAPTHTAGEAPAAGPDAGGPSPSEPDSSPPPS